MLHVPLWWLDMWPADEMSRWLAFSQVEALPDGHWDAALIAHTIARVMGGYKGKMDSFLPVVGEAKPLTHKQLKAKIIIGLRARRVDDGEDQG